MSVKARIIGGGTGIYELASRGLLSEVEALVDVSGLGWSYVRRGEDSVRIGSATTMAELARSPELESKSLGALADALKLIQPVQVKNVATVGGAICTGLPFFDLPAALIAMGAVVHVGPTGRKVELEEFVKGYFAVDLSPNEFVKEVEIPDGRDGRSSAFQKFALTSDDWAVVNCGVSLRLDKASSIHEIRMVFGGGIGDRPSRARKTEAALKGRRAVDEELKAVLEEELPADIEPVTDIKASSEYRMELAKVLGRRATLAALKRAG